MQGMVYTVCYQMLQWATSYRNWRKICKIITHPKWGRTLLMVHCPVNLDLHTDDGRNIIRALGFSDFTYPSCIALHIDVGTYIFLLNSKFCDSSGPQSTYIKFPDMNYCP